mmetsp:Transcript_17605/g.44768  ORF Transcript_17605/g.44768 Transcript_17605/m.44768 type:complete len:284 (-) Transcript_17605:235-1086(-)
MRNSAKDPETTVRLAEAVGMPKERLLQFTEAFGTAFDLRTEHGRQNLATLSMPGVNAGLAKKAARSLSRTTGVPLSTIDCCVRCGTRAPSGGRFKSCARCSTDIYCSKDCQKADRRTHKKACIPVKTPLPSRSLRKFDVEAFLANPDSAIAALNAAMSGSNGAYAIAHNRRVERLVIDWFDRLPFDGSIEIFRDRVQDVARGEWWLTGPINPPSPPLLDAAAPLKKLYEIDMIWFTALCFQLAAPDTPTEAEFYDGQWGLMQHQFPERERVRKRREGTAARFL